MLIFFLKSIHKLIYRIKTLSSTEDLKKQKQKHEYYYDLEF